ncbi:MAG: ABC transporter ATP-binding protein [Deltaproteobacteria bacterium]|nr:ABC transporter ATP-binding protein [Deltaproteobacteria bacterium]MBW1919280.1 ABC transporter ATP-binding protein [Deltaproteobacteria bacterium]MBW1933936.1 ABC transporter ATP-binding protein [Deltaproteobacteria bacterium]MBW1976991.1 ABC transporter ATP-binding protein [Deltaproteobacteria bacterium]MBW2043712.1 ABC transporter ATP-binding protein [Deltaproteobacteria bacterium]
MLEIKEVDKSFGGLMAVCNCSLDVKEGSITGLIGPNGAGKTTLFNVITGHYKPDKGKIFFQGEEINGLPPHHIFKKKIYRTFQITREFAQMTVLENLMLIPEHQVGEKIWNTWFRQGAVKKQEKAIKEKALEVLEFVELIDLKDEYAGSLSGGQKKLLELARSMMADPRMVLLDEPGAGVNRTLMGKLIDNIRKLCEEKSITFLLIEHDMDLVMNLCNPVIVMSEGKKLAEGTPEEIKRNKKVLEAYLGGQYR